MTRKDIPLIISGGPAFGAPLPLLAVRLAPAGLDDHNRAARILPTFVSVAVDHNSGGTAKVTAVQVSYDQGKTWKPTPVITLAGRSFVVLSHPAGANSVSFKASAKDADGNTVAQTIIDGILLKQPGWPPAPGIHATATVRQM